MAQSPQAKTATTKTIVHFTDSECALMGCREMQHPTDSLSAALTRAEAVVSLLAIQLAGNGDAIAPSLIGEILWAVEGSIQQAKAIADRLVIL